jgi:outer membrane protein insertion porin family
LISAWRQLALWAVLSFLTTPGFASEFRISDIRVEGLQRISAGTVFNYLPVQVGDVTTDQVTATIIRTLYGTGFFKDVKVERDGTVLVITVQERRAIAEINISGNKDIKTEDLNRR